MKVILFFVVIVLLSSGVFAISGVNPRSSEIDFVPNYVGEFNLNFFIDGNSKVDLYVKGDLAEYVSLNKEKISGRESVVVLLNLPLRINNSGVNEIRIVAGDVMSVIKINVPYPEKYVELELSAPSVNVGDSVGINLKVFSKGSKFVRVKPKIEIYKIEDWELESKQTEKLVDVLEANGEVVINESEMFEWSLNTSNYSMGQYLAIAVVDYEEGVAQIENSFKVGGPLVRVLNYTKEFTENKINKFEIEVENLGDDDIKKIYAEINIVGFGEEEFVTSGVGLGRWRTATLSGFLDSTKISKGVVEAEVVLHYDGKVNSQIIELKILEGFDYVFYGVIFIVLAVIGLLIWRGKRFIRKYKELKNQNKKKVDKK